MQVKELIAELSEYNPDAEVYSGQLGEYNGIDVCFGGSEGCTCRNCDYIHLFNANAISCERY